MEAVQEDDEMGMDEEKEDDFEEQLDANFDFGRAKMDYFKQRAKDILMSDTDLEYDGTAMQLGMCFKSLKNAIRNPLVVHGGSENKPHYLKMTFSTCRAAVNGDKYIEISKLLSKDGSLVNPANSSSVSTLQGASRVPALMRAGYGGASAGEDVLAGLTAVKRKTKKEEMIDKKIERLLETYKKQDEELLKQAGRKTDKNKAERQKLRDKFGFSDDEDDGGDGDESSHTS